MRLASSKTSSLLFAHRKLILQILEDKCQCFPVGELTSTLDKITAHGSAVRETFFRGNIKFGFDLLHHIDSTLRMLNSFLIFSNSGKAFFDHLFLLLFSKC